MMPFPPSCDPGSGGGAAPRFLRKHQASGGESTKKPERANLAESTK